MVALLAVAPGDELVTHLHLAASFPVKEPDFGLYLGDFLGTVLDFVEASDTVLDLVEASGTVLGLVEARLGTPFGVDLVETVSGHTEDSGIALVLLVAPSHQHMEHVHREHLQMRMTHKFEASPRLYQCILNR